MRSTGASSARSPAPNGSRGSRLRRRDTNVPAAHHGSRPTGSQHGALRVRAPERCHPSRKRHGLPDRPPSHQRTRSQPPRPREIARPAGRDKLAQLDDRTRRAATVSLGIPAYRDIAARTATLPGNLP